MTDVKASSAVQTVLGHRKLNLLPQRSGNRFKRLSLLLFSGLLPPVAYSSDQGRAIYLQRARLHQQHLTPPSSTFSQFSQKTTPNKPTSTTRLSARPISQLCQRAPRCRHQPVGHRHCYFFPGRALIKHRRAAAGPTVAVFHSCLQQHTQTHTHTPRPNFTTRSWSRPQGAVPSALPAAGRRAKQNENKPKQGP